MAQNPRRIEFATFHDMATHLDQWATDRLNTPDRWEDALLMSRSWLDYSARNQVLLASYGTDGPVAGPETWRLVPSTTEGRGCAVRAGEHGYPVRVPVTTGGSEPDPHLGGTRPTRAAVERWEWRPVFSIAQLARRPAPDTLVATEPPAALTGPDAEGEFLAAVRKVATATVRSRLPKSDDPHRVLSEAAGRLRRSRKRPELDPELREQVAWLVADRVSLAGSDRPPAFEPGGLAPRERWERLQDVLEPARKLTAALGVVTGVDLTAPSLPRMEIVDDRVVPAGRRHRLPAASLEQLPVGRWVTVGPYSPTEWAARGETGAGQGAYLRLNKTAYLVAIETGTEAAWRLEDVASRTGYGLLATGTATDLQAARDDAVTAVADRYPVLNQPTITETARSPGGTAGGWEQMPGPGRVSAELCHLDDQITLYVMPGPGGRWQPAIHTTTSGVLERLPFQDNIDDARTSAEIAGLTAQRVTLISDPARGDTTVATFADSSSYSRQELAALISHRLDNPTDTERVKTAEPAELVELLGRAGLSPATAVAVLHAEHLDPTTAAPLLPQAGVLIADAIGVLHERWNLPRTQAAELLDATAVEMRDAGCSAAEVMATRPRDVLRTLPNDPHLWELAAGTMATGGHATTSIIEHLVAHAPTPDTFAAGLTTIADTPDGLVLAAQRHAHPDQLAASSEAYGLSPTDTANTLNNTVDADVVLDTLTIRCDQDLDAVTTIATHAGIEPGEIDAWLHPSPAVPVSRIGTGVDTDTSALLATLPPPGLSRETDPIDLLDNLTTQLDHTAPEPPQ